MAGVFSGVRVIELAQHVYVPGAAVLLADQGAEVIKIETIEGDPYRTLQAGGNRNLGDINLSMEQNNRNKQSLALDLKTADGREALLRLVETADVFLTSLRPKAIRALRLDVDDVRARNPRIIYARGNGLGFRGEEADRPGFDASAFWARGGACFAFTRPGEQPTSPRPAFGDHIGSLAIAYGLAAALFKRAMTGEPSVVENSLLATATWALSGDLSLSQLPGYQTHPAARPISPLKWSYTTRDGRMIQFMMLFPDPHWAPFARVVGIDELIDDPRFATEEARVANADALIGVIQAQFSKRDYAEWKGLLETIDAPWEPIASIHDLAHDPQVLVNGMIQPLQVRDVAVNVVAGPTAFDGEQFAHPPRACPALGADTDSALALAGYSAEEVAELRRRGVAR